MRLLLIILALMQVVTGAASSCDPQTQYEKNVGQCCKKCGPGTRMTSSSSCLDPLCEDCKNNEYQESYTAKTICELQPYCDPHKNFQPPANQDKTRRSSCTCKPGYHCSSVACLTCVRHTTCKPGYQVQSKGNHTHDTVCQECAPDTFSSGTSEEGPCKEWKVCESGFQIKTRGTATSDTICEEGPRGHWIAVIVVICVVLLLVIGFVIYKLRGNKACTKGKVKLCMESCLEGPKEPEREGHPAIANPMPDKHSLTSEVGASQQEAAMTPEENDDDEHSERPSLPLISEEKVFTENGNVVAQEDGKKEIISRQESHSLLTLYD